MRVLPWVAVTAALAVVAWLVGAAGRPVEAPARAERTGEDPVARALLARQDEELARLREQVRHLDGDVAAMRRAFAEGLARGGSPGGGEFELRAYLDEYVRSFRDGGTGSEYFRLAVDAYAVELLDDLLRVLDDGATPPALRAQLIAMLGTARFRDNGKAVQALLDAAGNGDVGALKALLAIGNADTARHLAERAWSFEGEARKHVLDAVARTAGAERNRILARLYHGAPDDAARAEALARLDASDRDTALAVLRDASVGPVPVRLAAAAKLGQMRDDPFRALIEERLAAEREPAVRDALEKAKESQGRIPNWHALKATGPPDAEPPTRDHPNAWATASGNMGRQWIELTYARAMRVDRLRIYEVNVAGAVAEIETVDEAGARRRVWQGDDPTQTPGVFEVAIPPTPYRVKAVRVILDTDRRSGWNEIDAVEIVGPDGRGWAEGATASSTYGEGAAVRFSR